AIRRCDSSPSIPAAARAMYLAQPRLPVPLLVEFPFPSWATRPAEAEKRPIGSGAEKRPTGSGAEKRPTGSGAEKRRAGKGAGAAKRSGSNGHDGGDGDSVEGAGAGNPADDPFAGLTS
ncbi:MAG: hypothetical protein AAFO29_17820, partial [Actinomycetota bacterium]